MQITLTNIGKKYFRNWVFKNVNFTFEPNSKTALLGSNGSGKSTLLQIISGHVNATEGKVMYTNNNIVVDAMQMYKHLAYCAPALELIEEFTIQEFLEYHFKHKKCTSTITQILDYINLKQQANTTLQNCSSGMKQRVKLAQAFFSDVPLLFLDEPCTNLDENGIALYNKMIAELTQNKTIIVSSNDAREYTFCSQILEIANYKNA